MAEENDIGQVLLKALGAGLEGYAQGAEQKRQAQNVNTQQNYENQLKMQEAQQNKMLLSARLAELDANTRLLSLKAYQIAHPEEGRRLEDELKAEQAQNMFKAFQTQASWAKSQGAEQFRAGDLGVTFPTAREQSAGSGTPMSTDQLRAQAMAKGDWETVKKINENTPSVIANTERVLSARERRDIASIENKKKAISSGRYGILTLKSYDDLSDEERAFIDAKNKEIEALDNQILDIQFKDDKPQDSPSGAGQPTPEEARALLVAKGYVQDTNGNWVKK